MRALALPLLLVAGASAASSAPVLSPGEPLDFSVAQAKREAAAARALQQRAAQAAVQARSAAGRLRLEQFAATQAIAAEEALISSADGEALLLRARVAAAAQALATERAPVSSLLAGLAMIGQRPALTLLADADSPSELIKLKLLIEAITPHIAERSAALAARLDQRRALEQAALAARDRSLGSRKRLEQRKAELAALEAKALALAERSGGAALGAGDVVLAREEQAALLERRGAGGRRSLALAADLARHGPARLRPGSAQSLRAPFAYRLPATVPVMEGLGNLSDSGVRSRGITLATRRGQPIAVPASGTIVFAGPFRDYDGVIIIDHGRGWRTVLVNAGTAAARGSKVVLGQRLGTALGPVEVQLRHRGRPVSAAIIAGSSALLSKAPLSG